MRTAMPARTLTRLAALALVPAALLGTAACGGNATPAAAPTVTTTTTTPASSATTSPDPVVTSPGTTTNRTTSRTTSVTEAARTTVAGAARPGRSVPTAGLVDWLMKIDNCGSRGNVPDWRYRTWVLTRGDLTGDGRKETVLAARCPLVTSSPPVSIVVLDGTSDATTTRVIARFDGDYWREPHAKVTGRGTAARLVVSGRALSDHASLCCANTDLTVRYRWADGLFAVAGRSAVEDPRS